jgi:hypothetical protein
MVQGLTSTQVTNLSALPALSPLELTDIVAVYRAGEPAPAYQGTISDLLALASGGGTTVTSFSVGLSADQDAFTAGNPIPFDLNSGADWLHDPNGYWSVADMVLATPGTWLLTMTVGVSTPGCENINVVEGFVFSDTSQAKGPGTFVSAGEVGGYSFTLMVVLTAGLTVFPTLTFSNGTVDIAHVQTYFSGVKIA